MDNQVKVHINPDDNSLNSLIAELKTSPQISEMIQNSHYRIEFVEEEQHLFIIFYIPEYNSKKRMIETVEVDVLFNLQEKSATVFAYNTEYFFEKYADKINSIKVKGFGSFIEKFLSVILEDESRIIEHILSDTEEIKKEYAEKSNHYALIRHLTNNQINISSLKLIATNQNKVLELINDYLTKNQHESLTYKRNYILEELNYAAEFCEALMTSVDTKFNIQTSEVLFKFARYSFAIAAAEMVILLITFYQGDMQSGLNFFSMGILASLIVTIIVFFTFRKR